MDQNIKEITETVESRLYAEMGSEIQKYRAGRQYDKRISWEKKSELVTRARKIINADQLMELNGIVDILGSSEFSGRMSKFYVLIEKLVEKWVDISIRFRLIRSLIESLKTFRKVPNLKILVALRSDILERVLRETSEITFQREKFEDYFVRLKWTKAELKELVDRRISLLFKRQYSGTHINFEDLFRHRVANQDPFDYILERTMMRPRDVITFINEYIRESDGRYEVSAAHVKRAELEFSRIRRDALEQEWKSVFPNLGYLLNFIARRREPISEVRDLCAKELVEELAFSVCASGRVEGDPTFQAARAYVERGGEDPFRLVREAIEVLYRVNAIGVKLTPQDRYLYSYMDQPILSADALNMDARVRIHPMLHGTFRLTDIARK